MADKTGYYITRLEATDGLMSGFSNTLITSALACDADASGVLNQNDLALISAALGKGALANDPRDFNHDGQITSADVTACTNLISSLGSEMQVTPTSFTETRAEGNTVITEPLQITATGNALTFTVSSNQSWLTSSITSGSTGSVSGLNALVNTAGLNPGTFQGALTFTPSSGAPQTVSVSLTITGSGNFSLCDVNRDTNINVVDVQLMVNEALGVLNALHDLNADGFVNVVDVQIDINAALGLGCAAHQ